MTRAPSFDAASSLRAVMAAQGGVFTAAQARACGYSPREVERLRRHRLLISVRRGVYAAASSYLELEPLERHRTDTLAALLCLKQPVTLSHETAAVWTELPLLRPELRDLHVTRPELSAARLEAHIHHHDGALPPDHVIQVSGTAATSPARTAVDIARHVDFERGLAACDSALRSGTSREGLQAVMEFCSSWPGARGAGRAVSYADGRAANPGESWSRAVLIEAGIPPTSLQLEVRDAAGLVGYADFGWEGHMTLGEFDGRWKYAVAPGASADEAARVLWAEKRREDRLRALGFTVVRWAWEDLFQPDRLAARIRAAFAEQGARRRTA